MNINNPYSSNQPNKSVMSITNQHSSPNRKNEINTELSNNYDHIHSPMRDIIRRQEDQYNNNNNNNQYQQYQSSNNSKNLNLYQSSPVDAVDNFVKQFRPGDNTSQMPYKIQPSSLNDPNYAAMHANMQPPQNYHPMNYMPQYASQQQQQYQQQQPYYPSPYESYNQQQQQQHQYQQQQQQHYTQPGYIPPNYNAPHRNNDIQNKDLSIASESRLLPANPWSSSDILSSLVPVGITARNAHTQQNASDLERSLASNSMLMYLGQRTPAEGMKVLYFIIRKNKHLI